MKTLLKSTKAKYSLSALVLIAIIGVFTISDTNAESQDNEVAKVLAQAAEMQDIADNLTFSSNVEGEKETLLSFNLPGRINAINYSIGDIVKKGELISSLEAENYLARRGMAATASSNAASTYSKTNSLMSEKLKDAELSLKNSQENLENVKKNLKNDNLMSQERLRDATISLQLAKTQREDLVKTLDQKERNLYEALESSVNQSVILSNSVLSNLYSINGRSYVSGTTEFKVSDQFITSGDTKNDARYAVLEFTYATKDLEDFYDSIKNQKKVDANTLMYGQQLAEDALTKGKDALQLMNYIVDDAKPHTGMSESQLSLYKSGIITYGTQLESMLLSQQSGSSSGVIGIKQSLDDLEIEKTKQLNEIEKQIELAVQKIKLLETGRETTQDDLSSKVKSAQIQVQQYEQNLATSKAQQALQLQLARSQLNSANAAYREANVSVQSSKIKAPYNGIIAEKYFDEGTVVNSGAPVLKIVDMSSLKLVIFVPESQISAIKIGDKGIATNENYPDDEFVAIVKRISPQVEKDSNKVRTELELNDPQQKLKIGMFMSLRIDFPETHKQVLSIPTKALQTFYDSNYVFVIEDERAVKKVVKTGTFSDERVEIVEGLNEGDMVISEGVSGLQDGQKIELIRNDEQ